MRTFLALLVALCFTACAGIPVRTNIVSEGFTPLPPGTEVTIVNKYETEPVNSKFIGMLWVGCEAGYAECSRALLLEKARTAAREQGANVIRMIEIKRVWDVADCPRIKFGLFHNDDQAAIAAFRAEHENNNASTLPAGTNYALVHFYRPANMFGHPWPLPIIGWEGKIAQLNANRKFTFRTTDFGPRRFQVGRNSPMVTVDVQPGEEYYLRFDLRTDGIVTLPDLFLVDNIVGREDVKTVRPFDKNAPRETE